jgi:hypothetical protein
MWWKRLFTSWQLGSRKRQREEEARDKIYYP